jgi:hypothetical protein
MPQPASDTTLASWRAGEDVDLLAPFCGPGSLFGDERVLVVVPRDSDALAFASSAGAELILRTTTRQRRTRSLTSGAPVASPVVVTSVDALRSSVLRRALQDSLGAAPWCIWWPEALLPSQPGHGGRGAWIDTLRQGFTGGLLRRWSDGALAPEGCAEQTGTPGALRFGTAAPSAARVRSVGRGLLPRDWIRAAIGAGQARREHELRAPWPRAWRESEEALRESESGVDLLADAGGALPRGCTLAPSVPGLWGLAVPDGAAVAWGGVCEQVTATAGDAPADGPGWLVWSADEAAERALEGWASAGSVTALRASWFEARIADHHRFRAPFVEREPEYAELHRVYTAAMQGWDLQQRAAFALSDRGPRDLVALGRELDRSPAWLADVLLAMADDGIVAGELRGRGPGVDWQADHDGDWVVPESPSAAEVDPRIAILLDASGCRAQALAVALRASDPGVCGRCDRCDSGMGWFETVSIGSPRAGGPLAHAPSSAAALDLGALFKGLGSGPAADSPPLPKAPPSARRRPPARPKPSVAPSVPVLSATASDSDVESALESVPAAALWAAAAYQHRGPMAGRPLPAEARDALLSVLCGDPVPGATVRRGDGGRVQIHLPDGPARGSHQFRPREAGTLLLLRLAPHDVEGGPLGRLLLRQREREDESAWFGAVATALFRALDAEPGLPPMGLLNTVARAGGREVPAAWLESSDPAVEACRHIAQPELLAQRGRERLEGKGTLTAPEDRLCLRALAGAGTFTLPPSALRRWLGSGEPLPAALLGACRGGSRRAWAELLLALPASMRDVGLRAAVAARRLPQDAARLAMGLAAGWAWEATVLMALPPDPSGWPAAERDLADQQALLEALVARDHDSPLAVAGRTFLARVAADDEARAEIVVAGAAGKIAAAFTALAERGVVEGRHFTPTEEQASAFSLLRSQAAREQKAYTPALARALASGALASGAVGEAGVQALDDAAAAGWAGALVALLRGQARKHPGDAARKAWLARALSATGRWAEALALYRDADRLLGGDAGLDLLWQGLEAVLQRCPDEALPWLEAAVRRGPPREISRRIGLLAWGGKIPPAVASPLAQRLRDEGSGVWAGAMRALEQLRQ